MKLEMKKIALILAAGILAFSGAFGENTKNFTRVEVVNNMNTNYKASIDLKVDGKKLKSIYMPIAGSTNVLLSDYSGNEIGLNSKLTFGLLLGKRKFTNVFQSQYIISDIGVDLQDGKAQIRDLFQNEQSFPPEKVNVTFEPKPSFPDTLLITISSEQ